ncbi:MAG: hypothetical protein PHX54_12855 [Lentimicrobiaceae bacterium]|nr:hypothetical protein [Lentimicrobiaceae bacterium]
MIIVLQFKRNLCQLGIGDDLSFPTKTELAILAKNAAHVAVTKKYSTRAMSANQRRFFPHMRAITGKHHFICGSAKTKFFPAVHTTIMRA